MAPTPQFDLGGRVAVISGGYGVLGGTIASGLAAANARVAILGRRRAAAEEKAAEIRTAGGNATVLVADVLDHEQLITARDELLTRWGRVDILVNAAGGNVARPERRSAGVRRAHRRIRRSPAAEPARERNPVAGVW